VRTPYWANAGDGTIKRLTLATANDELTIAAGQQRVDAIAIDGAYVYWTNLTAQTVARAPR
jgi:hypothetical protein